ncbi:MAG: glycyl-radical enzyme activating protein [Bacteroidales bacterium]|nr:glycyl-radical enzyme activating protein [Bacteroidales bacterium]
MHAYIFNIQRFSIHDGPGIRTTVFFQGCPLQCVWCHNAEGIPQFLESSEGDKIPAGIKIYSIDELLEEVLKDRVFFDESGGGVSFSGGEPLMQTEFLLEILKKLRELNIHTTVDTSGYAPTGIFKEVVALTDLVLFDLKIIDNKKHNLYTGTDNSLIHANLDHLAKSKIPFRIRIPLVNEMTADDENLISIAVMLKGKGDVDIDLLSYHALGFEKQQKTDFISSNTKLTAPGKERIEEIRDLFRSYDFNVNIGG